MRLNIKNYNKSKYELLSPAGSFEALKAAVSAGCDAVYVGGNMFGARAFANNFSKEELFDAIDYCHTYGKALYLTVNTLLKNNEIDDELYEYIRPLYEAGLDAVIVQDLGVLNFIKNNFPDLEIHASTQMTVLGENFANELKKMGVARVVTPRELSLKEIKNIYDNTNMEIETFIHGALCYCYSGQCLMSSVIGGRSGNRGKCAQPCRLPYSIDNEEGEYYLSPKDLCSLKLLPDLLEAGIYSLKIEGRMKSPEYVATVTSIYRKYIDLYEKNGKNRYIVDENDINKLLDIYNRGGFTEGFFKKQNSSDIIFTKKPNHMGVSAGIITKISGNNIYFNNTIDLNKNDVLEFRLKNKEYISFNLGNDFKKNSKCTGYLYKKNIKNINELYSKEIFRTKNNALSVDLIDGKLRLQGYILIKENKNVMFEISLGDIKVLEYFDIPSKAQKQELTKDVIIKQLNKTGNELFNFEQIEVELDSGLFLPMGALNQIRRITLDKFKQIWLNAFKRDNKSNESNYKISINENNEILGDEYSALVSTKEQLSEVLNYKEINNIYVEQSAFEYDELESLCKIIRNANKTPYLALPYITRYVFLKELRTNIKFYLKNDYEGYMFRNLETYFMFKNEDISLKDIIFDSHIYTFNNYSYEYYKDLGAKLLTASYEHNLKDLKAMEKKLMEVNVYGYIPVMQSANCIMKTTSKCKTNFNNKTELSVNILKDRLGNEFKYICNCRYCYNIIYNNVPLSISDEILTLSNYGFRKFRLNFTIESANETRKVLELYFNDKSDNISDYTKGHLKRGV